MSETDYTNEQPQTTEQYLEKLLDPTGGTTLRYDQLQTSPEAIDTTTQSGAIEAAMLSDPTYVNLVRRAYELRSKAISAIVAYREVDNAAFAFQFEFERELIRELLAKQRSQQNDTSTDNSEN